MSRTAVVALTLLMTACAGCLVQAAPAPSRAGSRPPIPASSASGLEREIHELVNRRRASSGLAPLRWDDRIATIAREHSEAMAAGRRSFSHDGFGERAARVAALLPVGAMAENVAYDSRTGPELGRQVVEGWIGSPGHLQNIEGAFTVTGVGAARGNDGIAYFTQIFVQTRE